MKTLSLLLLCTVSFVLGAFAQDESPQNDFPINPVTFGNGVSDGGLHYDELTLLDHSLSILSMSGTMTHFWISGDPAMDVAVIRYYVDGELIPSIEFQPYLACGAGFDDQTAPWGNSWFGKGARGGGWYNNIRIPFGKHIKVTAHLPRSLNVSYPLAIFSYVRGVENLPTYIGNYRLPNAARAKLIKIENLFLTPGQFVTLASQKTGQGLVFLHVLSVSSGNLAFLEGCYRIYMPYDNQVWPGTLLSTGTEDYFDSAYYFDAGISHMEAAGLTHMRCTNDDEQHYFINRKKRYTRQTKEEKIKEQMNEANKSNVNKTPSRSVCNVSAYKIHDKDIIGFRDGFAFEWRNGDMADLRTGQKCFTKTGGKLLYDVTNSTLTSYTWIYTW